MSYHGNTGHRGYTLQKVVAAEAKSRNVIIMRLSCGHTCVQGVPYPYTAQEWLDNPPVPEAAIKVGLSRRKCERCRNPKKDMLGRDRNEDW